MKKINLSNKNLTSYTQVFRYFSEENWEEKKSDYASNTSLFFSGKKDEIFTLLENHSVVFLIGLGQNFQDFQIQKISAKFSQTYKKQLQSVPTKIEADFLSEAQILELIKGLFIGTYQYPFTYEHPFWQAKFQLHLDFLPQKKLDELAAEATAVTLGQTTAMEWLNKPANFKKVPEISAFLKEISEKYQFKYQSFNRKEAKKLGLGAYLAVNQGSESDGAFTVIEYQTSKKKAKTIGLVGKCVLFDTGGISLKNPDNMHYMKSDMGGATAVIGTLIAAAELQLPVNIVAVLPVTDNAISEKAYLPSDVVKAYNGKTIEILNTDAEGRLTLADGLSYIAKNYKTDVLIDLATLTGSAVRMFGDTCGALFSNNQTLISDLINSADQTNQRLWNLPLWDVWKDDFKSDVADFKNISLKPIGDCIVAGKFLEEFIEHHPSWAHLDIAAMCFGNVIYAREKAATGYGVQLLLNFIQNLR